MPMPRPWPMGVLNVCGENARGVDSLPEGAIRGDCAQASGLFVWSLTPKPGNPSPEVPPAMSERSVFLAALEIDGPEERSAYHDRAFAGDADYPALAIAYHRLDRADDARRALASAEKAIDQW